MDKSRLSTLQQRGCKRARKRGLRYTTDDEPGIARRRAGRGFVYIMPDGGRVRDDATLERIRALAVPPAYTDVWICSDRRGHLQATGRDARGRKQYRYHAGWRDDGDTRKYRRLVRFGEALPVLRAQLQRDLARQGLPRDKVLAVMTRMMMITSMRIGSAANARDNHSYGLTMLLSRHVAISRDRAVFRFRGKGGKMHEATLTNHRLIRIVRRCQKLPGRSLFQYEEEGMVHRVRARQLNEYLCAAMGGFFSAKDFRTWTGTLTVITLLARTPLPEQGGERARRAAINAAIAAAAEQLGNTPAVCRKAYVYPRVLDGWRSGALHRAVPAIVPTGSRRLEKAALRFVRSCLAKSD
ncbi:MAG TPA: DNA topoisomerase IB [Rhodanobacteraceae bacterium]|nr:DNA topoisomerase IB [Rhodanobacteraceae bacterium]